MPAPLIHDRQTDFASVARQHVLRRSAVTATVCLSFWVFSLMVAGGWGNRATANAQVASGSTIRLTPTSTASYGFSWGIYNPAGTLIANQSGRHHLLSGCRRASCI